MLLETLIPFVTTKITPLILSVVGFGLLVIIHELGHFLFCKLFGVYTPTFSIGFGPKIFEKKIGTTNFRLSALPLGGYVEMAGNAEIGQGDQTFAYATDETSFANKSYWKKLCIMVGGILFNLITAYIIFCSLFIIGSTASFKITINNIEENSSAQQCGLKPGDQLIEINSIPLSPEKADNIKDTFLKEIENNPDQKIQLIILRDNKTLTLSPVLRSKQRDGVRVGSLGASFTVPPPFIKGFPLKEGIVKGINYTNNLILDMAHSIKQIFSERSLKGAGGPIAIISTGFKTAQTSLISLFIFLAMMSINLALFNLLPLGILDGGQILFVTIEAIIRRPTPEWFKIGINLLSLAMFAVLFVYLTYKDIMNIFGEPLKNLIHTITSVCDLS